MKAFGLAAILGFLTLALAMGLSTGERVRANHTGADLGELDALHFIISEACEEVRTGVWETGDKIGFEDIASGAKFTVVKGNNDLNGMDSRGTKNRDIIVSTSADSENGVELSGGKGDDILCGGPGPDTLNGGSGNDYALGGPCIVDRCWSQPPNQIIDDTFNGGGGKDHFFGEAGNDFLNGGGNNDTLVGGPGNDEIWGGVGTSPAAFWPWLSPFMRGGSGDDFLFGQEGNDELHGGSGDDELWGGDGDDSLFGGNHNDELYGGEGDDLLDGGWHNDYCEGGAGSNTFKSC